MATSVARAPTIVAATTNLRLGVARGAGADEESMSAGSPPLSKDKTGRIKRMPFLGIVSMTRGDLAESGRTEHLIAGYHRPLCLGQALQHRHGLGLDMNHPVAALDQAAVRANTPLAEPEVARQGLMRYRLS